MDFEVAQRLLSAMPEPFRADRVTRLAGGEHSSVYELIDSTQDRAVILKVYPPGHAWEMTQERYVYELLGKDPRVPVPRVLLARDDDPQQPGGYLVMTKLPGTLIAWLGDLARPETEELYRGIAGTLRAIHSRSFSRFGFFSPHGYAKSFATNQAWMTAHAQELLDVMMRLGGRSEDQHAVRRFLEDRWEQISQCQTAVLCHNDLHEGNVLVARRDGRWQITGVIDVGGAIAADPLFDLARTLYWAAGQDSVKRAALLSSYGPASSARPGALQAYVLCHAIGLGNWYACHKPSSPILTRIKADIHEMLREPNPTATLG